MRETEKLSFLDRVHFGFSRRLPILLQTEATECGLACLAMVARYYRHQTDLTTLRRQFAVSMKGVTLASVMRIGDELGLGSRPLKLELNDLAKLRLPCILHWNFDHFVVLKAVKRNSVTIHDPSRGVRILSWDDVSKSFTGVALELWPTPDFKLQKATPTIRLRPLFGSISGLYSSCTQVLLLALALEVFALVSPFFLQWVIDQVIVSADRDLLTTLAVGFGLLAILQQVIVTVRAWALLYMGTTLSIQWQANIFAHLIRLPVQYFEKRHLGDIVSRFNASDQIQHTLTTSFIEAILDGVMASLTLTLMFMYSPILGGMALSVMVLYIVARYLWYRPLRRATEEQIIHAARQNSYFLETVRGVKSIKLFQRQDERKASWLALLADQINAELSTHRLRLLYRLLNGILFGVEQVAMVWVGARLVIDGHFSVGVLMAFVAYKGQFVSRVGGLVDKFFELKMLRLQGERLSDIVLTEPETVPGLYQIINTHTLTPSITIRSVRFRYSPLEPYVLDGVDLTLAAGESVAIIGASGSGKTTLMNIMLGILPITEGDIFIGDVSLRQLGVDQLRQLVGTVLQDDVLFAGTIGENISFFDPNTDHTWIVKCAELAAIANDITNMPMGYNTLVGDMGTVLSGGQKQRILLARALYKRPRILLLDEATSHLDLKNEKCVNEAINNLDITRVIIAHRPETIASASRVVMLENGKIADDYDNKTTHTH